MDGSKPTAEASIEAKAGQPGDGRDGPARLVSSSSARSAMPALEDAELRPPMAGQPASAPAPSGDMRSAAQETAAAAKVLARHVGVLARTAAVGGAQRAQGYAGGVRARLRGLGARFGAPFSRAAGWFGAALRRLPGPDRPQTTGRPRSGWLRRIVGFLGATLAAGFVGVLAFVAYAVATIPLGGGLQVDASQSALVLEAGGGQVFATRGVFKGERLTVGDLPRELTQAIVSVEDRRFYEHHGIDVRGTLRALWRNTQAGSSREGGSTITQQLVRLMYLSPDKHLRRKVQEAVLALWLERQLTKEEILVRYLNTAYFGAGAYGVDAAAKRYFGKRPKDLSLAEAAMLAGLVRAPSQLAPTRNLGGAKERADTVLQTMVETGAITAEQADAARKAPVNLRTPPETPPGANYFVDVVAGETRRVLGPASGDLMVRTTLNLDLQRLAEGVIERRLEAEGQRKGVSQAALVAMAPDGAILAMVGGRDYEASQFNRATQARRQAGSLFKLFVYLAAFQRGGYTPQTVLVDRPTQVGDWEPQNASGRFRGAVTLREAFASSINTVAVQLADEVGIQQVIDTARRLGVQSDLPAVPSLALGSAEVTLLEMTRAYAALASGAGSVEPYTVRSIGTGPQQAFTTRGGGAGNGQGSLGQSRAMMIELLQAVVREGTGRGARVDGVTVGGKTGTTQENKDAWFVGFTNEIIVGVWVGNDDNTPMNGVTGGDLPATIFREFTTRAVPLVTGRGPNVAAAAPGRTTPAARPESRPEGPLRGVPEVVDTGTLTIRGRVVRLQGLEGEGGRLASQLARFLRRREVACEPAGSADLHRCQLDGEDLSELILAAGGARASAGAPSELLTAEEQARSARLGLWRRQ